MRFSSSLVVVRGVRLVVGISLLLGVLRQPVLAQESTPPGNNIDTVADTATPTPTSVNSTQIAPRNLSDQSSISPITPPENKPDPREPAPPQQLDLKYEEKDWTQPVDPNATVDEDLRNPKIKKNTTDYMTATLPITDVRGLGETIRVELRLESTRVVPGGELRGTVYVGSGQAQPEVGLVLNLPKGLDYVADSAPNASFDAKTGELTWQMNLDESGLATLPFVLRVLPDVKREALKLDVKPLAQGNDKRNYQMGKPAKLRVADADATAELDSKGGTLTVDNDRVVLEFGAGTLKDARTFVASVFKTDIGNKAERQDGTQGTAEDFSPLTLEVTPDTTFEAPITAIVNLSGLIPAEMLAKGLVPELRYARAGELDVAQTDAKGEQRMVQAKGVDYETVPGHWDPITQKLTVLLSHFSTCPVGFSVPSGAPQPWKLGANLGDVSLFRGSMNWSLPIAVPSFPNGAPGLAIAYSSAGSDSGSGRMASSDYRLGWGWDLNGVPSIQRGVKANKTGPGFGNSYYEMLIDQWYRLSLGGRDYNLVYKSSISNTSTYAYEFVPEDYSPIKAVKCRVGFDCGGIAQTISVSAWQEYGGTVADVYWQVWTPDGTRYVFGTNAVSTVQLRLRSNGGVYYQKWYLTRMADLVRDNPSQNKWSAEYSYEEDPSKGDNGETNHGDDFSKGADWEQSTRLTQVIYGNSQATLSRPYKVVLTYTVPVADLKRLSHITVQSNDTNLRQYVFGFSTLGGNRWNDEKLKSIIEYGRNGTGWAQLPTTEFYYKSDSQDLNDPQKEYGLLYDIRNGYGGRIRLDFKWWGGLLYSTGYNTLQNRWLLDGMGNITGEQYEFTDGTQCYNEKVNPGTGNPSACYFGRDEHFPESRNKIMGFSEVWKTVAPANSYVMGTALSVEKYTSHHAKQWLGKPSHVRVYNAAQTSVLAAQVNYYGLTQPAPNQPAGTWQTWLGTQDEFPQSDAIYSGNFFMKRTETFVDGLGNPTEIREHGYYNLPGDERVTRMGYATPNWSNWIVGKLGYENRYTGMAGQGEIFRTQTILYYDGNANWNDTPTLGQLKKAGRGNNQAGGVNWAIHDFAYDAAGNLNWIKDPRGFVSSAYYDDATLKPLFTDSPLWLGYSYARTYYRYFGRETVGHPGGQPWGEFHYSTDPNGQNINRVWYDPFGRVEKVIQPGDSDAEPTVKYVYGDAGTSSVAAPLKIETQQRENCNGCYIINHAYYDGLGRAVQTRAEAPSSKQRVTNMTYDALGRALRQYVPAEENNNPNYDRPAGVWNTRPNTLSVYDLLGRVTQVTGPDGTNSYLYYGNSNNRSLVRSVDARLNTKVQASNGLGHLVAVEEYAAPCGAYNDCNAAGSPNTTHYTYNAVYGLTGVTDAMNNGTTMGYDWLGRKTSMNDPDMGQWYYSYDANGNLTSQTDAKNQTLTFNYDVLNRMTDKFVGGVWTSWNRYDEEWVTGNAIGRRTRHGVATWTGANWSNETYFYYDARGRMTKEHRAVDGVGWFDTQYAYDSADRVTTMTYPDNEAVTTSYDAGGQPSSLQSTWGTTAANSTWLVSSASYNALGQPMVFNLGNTLSQRWYYYGSNLSAPHVVNGNTNWAYGKLRQTCVLAGAGDCWDWNVRTGGTQNTQLNLYNSYDVVGNVTQVYDRGTNGSPNYDHAYGYDALDRLTSWKMNTVAQETYTYNAIGNLTSKTGVGTMSYGSASGWGCTAGPHAMMYATGGHGACYDGNGNMTLRWVAGTPFIYGQTWNTDNKLIQLNKFSTDGAYTNLGTLADFYYDADGARVKTVINGVTTAYIGNHYEQQIVPALAPTSTPVPAPTNTPPPAPSSTPVPAPTNTPAPGPTNTPPPAPTNTSVPAPTHTPVPGGCIGLDCFNRANGAIGSNWVGNTGSYAISNNQLAAATDKDIFWNTPYSGDVWASIKLGTLSSGQSVALHLRALGGTYNNGVIEVGYTQGTGVKIYTSPDGSSWNQRGSTMATSFASGDVLKAVSSASGTVTVYKNGASIGSANVTAWSGYNRTGQVGIWTNAPGTLLDDFEGGSQGGGSAPTNTPAPPPTNTPVAGGCAVLDCFNRANGAIGGSWIGETASYSINANQLRAATDKAIYWNTTYSGDVWASLKLGALSSNQEVALHLRATGGTYTNGVIEVVYKQSSGIKVYTTADGSNWTQAGSTIATSFANGDVFKVVSSASGTVTVYKNGTSVGSANVTAWSGYNRNGQIGVWANASGALLDDFGGGTGSGASLLGAGKVLARLHSELGRRTAVLAPNQQGDSVTTLKYYYFGGQRVAMRKYTGTPTNTSVTWLHGDHLGSSSMSTNHAGGTDASARYKPFGEVRATSGTMPTNRKFNGNVDDGFGLLDFSARQYSPLLGRFISADSIVPRPGDPQSLNRFSYTRNSPLSRVDPTGHGDCDVHSQAGCQPWWISDQPLPAESLIITRKGGLIDTTHAGVTDIIAKVKNATQLGTDNKYKRAGALGIFGPIVFGSHKAEYAIAKGLSDKQIKQVALGIWMDYQTRFEQAQSDHGDIISGFGAEDLFSDLMGFYQELTGKSLQEVVNNDLGGVIGTMGEGTHLAYVGNAALFNCCEWVNRSHEFKPFRPGQGGEPGYYFDVPVHIKQQLGVAIGETNRLWRLISFESSGGVSLK